MQNAYLKAAIRVLYNILLQSTLNIFSGTHCCVRGQVPSISLVQIPKIFFYLYIDFVSRQKKKNGRPHLTPSTFSIINDVRGCTWNSAASDRCVNVISVHLSKSKEILC